MSNYNKFPVIDTKQQSTVCRQGWEGVLDVIKNKVEELPAGRKIIALECYPGVLDEEVTPQLQQALKGLFYFTADCMLSEGAVQQLVYPDVRTTRFLAI